jgi:hypothetical protein
MSTLHFSDGLEVDTRGEFRTLRLRGRWYVVGDEKLVRCADEAEAIRFRDEMKVAAEHKAVSREWEPTRFTYRNRLTASVADCLVQLWNDQGTTVCSVEAIIVPDSGPPFFIPGEPVRCRGTLARLEGERCLEAAGGGDGPLIDDKTIDEIRAWADRNGY